MTQIIFFLIIITVSIVHATASPGQLLNSVELETPAECFSGQLRCVYTQEDRLLVVHDRNGIEWHEALLIHPDFEGQALPILRWRDTEAGIEYKRTFGMSAALMDYIRGNRPRAGSQNLEYQRFLNGIAQLWLQHPGVIHRYLVNLPEGYVEYHHRSVLPQLFTFIEYHRLRTVALTILIGSMIHFGSSYYQES